MVCVLTNYDPRNLPAPSRPKRRDSASGVLAYHAAESCQFAPLIHYAQTITQMLHLPQVRWPDKNSGAFVSVLIFCSTFLSRKKWKHPKAKHCLPSAQQTITFCIFNQQQSAGLDEILFPALRQCLPVGCDFTMSEL